MIEKRPLARRHWLVDIGLALVLTAVAQYELRHLPDSGTHAGSLALNTASGLLVLALAFRQRCPLFAFAAFVVPHIVISLVAPHTLGFYGVAVPLAVLTYSVARWQPRPHSVWALLGTAVLLAVYGVHVPEFRNADNYVFGAGLVLGAWVAGTVIAALSDERTQLREALAEIEHLEEQRREFALTAERARIARDMHDVMAHGVSVMIVQAGSARMSLGRDDGSSRRALLAVEETGRGVLEEFRRTFGLLLADPLEGTSPSPGIADLERLIAGLRVAGLDIDADIDSDLDLDPGRGLTVYRVVQEALTNALRHSSGQVALRVNGPDPVHIEVTSVGRADGTTLPDGNGLVGMRERVEMYAGRFWAEPTPGGFVVRADIPAEVRS